MKIILRAEFVCEALDNPVTNDIGHKNCLQKLTMDFGPTQQLPR